LRKTDLISIAIADLLRSHSFSLYMFFYRLAMKYFSSLALAALSTEVSALSLTRNRADVVKSDFNTSATADSDGKLVQDPTTTTTTVAGDVGVPVFEGPGFPTWLAFAFMIAAQSASLDTSSASHETMVAAQNFLHHKRFKKHLQTATGLKNHDDKSKAYDFIGRLDPIAFSIWGVIFILEFLWLVGSVNYSTSVEEFNQANQYYIIVAFVLQGLWSISNSLTTAPTPPAKGAVGPWGAGRGMVFRTPLNEQFWWWTSQAIMIALAIDWGAVIYTTYDLWRDNVGFDTFSVTTATAGLGLNAGWIFVAAGLVCEKKKFLNQTIFQVFAINERKTF
jgi:hypothetical protein